MGERVPVALRPLAGDARDADALEHRHAPERLARVDVGQVHLDRGQPGDLERVAQRPGVVRPGARIEDQAVREVARLVELLDVLALEVGLEEAHLESELTAEAPDPLLEPHEAQAAVDLGRAAIECAEVDPVQHRHAVLHDRSNSATAARRSSGDTPIPVRTSPGASTSTNPTRPPRRFLSRAVAATTSAGSIAGSSRVGRPCSASRPATSSRSAGWAESVSAASSPSPTASPWR